MTPNEMRKIVTIAMNLALQAPKRRHQCAVSATVHWETIIALRNAMADAGIDWRELWDKARNGEGGEV